MSVRCPSLAILTQGGNVPSTRFRIGQYLPLLNSCGIGTTFFHARYGSYPPPQSWARPRWLIASLVESFLRVLRSQQFDICFIQRELISTLCTFEPLIKIPMIFDVDDAIFLHSRWNAAERIACKAALTICGNSFLADYFSRIGPVEILPTAVDTKRYRPQFMTALKRPTIGWSGSSSGFRYLYEIEPALNLLLERHRDAVIKIIADRPPIFKMLPFDRVIFEYWQPETEVSAMQDFTVGLMPLEDGLWERGKCSYKMLTYMAVGVPVVVSPVGMNIEVLAKGDCGYSAKSLDDWVEAVSCILSDLSNAAKKGLVGRQIVESHYSSSVIGPRLAEILKAQV